MSLLIGLDEAGYGPNLGPLAIAVTVWEVPDDPARCDPWAAFEGIVSRVADPTGQTVHIADSKTVHSPAAGIGPIERSATAILRLAGRDATTLFSLWDGLTEGGGRSACCEPWFREDDLVLPLADHPTNAFDAIKGWSARCGEHGVRLVAVAGDLVTARRFNDSVRLTGTKGRLLSESTLALLRRVWNPAVETPALVLCDKHGGRNRYADLLAGCFPDHLPLGLEESGRISRYRLGSGEIRFQARAEEHLPVAAASIVAKYLREASMAAFNRFWLARHPGLRPTAGYPLDAKRFLAAIEADAASLGLDRDDFWRSR